MIPYVRERKLDDWLWSNEQERKVLDGECPSHLQEARL